MKTLLPPLVSAVVSSASTAFMMHQLNQKPFEELKNRQKMLEEEQSGLKAQNLALIEQNQSFEAQQQALKITQQNQAATITKLQERPSTSIPQMLQWFSDNYKLSFNERDGLTVEDKPGSSCTIS